MAPSISGTSTRGSALTSYWRAIRAAISLARSAATRMRTSFGRCGRPAVRRRLPAKCLGGSARCRGRRRRPARAARCHRGAGLALADLTGRTFRAAVPLSSAIALQFGHAPRSAFGTALALGACGSWAKCPIIPFSAQLATGFSLQFGHFPFVPLGQNSDDRSCSSATCPVVSLGHLRTMVLQSGHLPVVPLGHLRDPVRTQSGQIALGSLGADPRCHDVWGRLRFDGLAAGLALRQREASARAARAGRHRRLTPRAVRRATAKGSASSPNSSGSTVMTIPDCFSASIACLAILIAVLRAGKAQAIEAGFRSIGHDRIESFRADR